MTPIALSAEVVFLNLWPHPLPSEPAAHICGHRSAAEEVIRDAGHDDGTGALYRGATVVMTARVLPVAEWPRLDATALAPIWRTLDIDPRITRVLVIEEDGAIVGHWVATRIWHLEGVHVARPALFRRLWRLAGETLEALGVRTVWTAAGKDDTIVREMLARVGATPIPIDHFVIQVSTPETAGVF